MSDQALIKKINRLKSEKNAVILVHNYQRPEIYEVADFIGDSLELAREAQKTDAKIIVFCGVDFMAESAKILNPDKKVLLPAIMARCPMAAMVDEAGLVEMQKKYPEAATVGYINTSAATKALCDVCCTSANVIEVVGRLEQKQIIFVPDKNLADYAQSRLPDKQIIPWAGFCYVHNRILSQQLQEARRLHPEAVVIAHPECPADVIKLADAVASTSGMLKFASRSDADEFIIATEMGMTHRLQTQIPDKKFYSAGGVCVQMKKNTLELVYQELREENNEITVPEDVRLAAKRSLDKMLSE
ncbi:MAG: quinolinate synthase [Candidatus Magasanikbacteria bacterium CG10_big_fil_rev_8_21_14_0_10_40_10]|uniref:Quinolinate synthase n=1 Tax=Candidatus Magasanikbacteria bacterium CG10_big_fil_rev_8_21_14_0_10_40_10 TaxID=1974648 RepID=A0A2M6W2Z4_9BACT|nr:MAG: quinolinate synthase [Candidatus Magasanikbacteria bacterium CG10_big_fil_rev_8_21_14_0_10_40_10]